MTPLLLSNATTPNPLTLCSSWFHWDLFALVWFGQAFRNTSKVLWLWVSKRKIQKSNCTYELASEIHSCKSKVSKETYQCIWIGIHHREAPLDVFHQSSLSVYLISERHLSSLRKRDRRAVLNWLLSLHALIRPGLLFNDAEGFSQQGLAEKLWRLFPMFHFLFWGFGVTNWVAVSCAVHEHFIQPFEWLYQVVLECRQSCTDGWSPKTMSY